VVNTGSQAVQLAAIGNATGTDGATGSSVLPFEDNCAGPTPVLLPAERCAFQVGWRGDAAVTASETLVLQAVGGTASAEWQIAVRQAEARPVASGGGAMAGLYVLGLALSATGLAVWQRRRR
jgi:hypothetical protein